MREHRRKGRGQRGVALLLVMVGLVVCTLLTAGFLATQGTSIGIARNERDAEACRFLAETGIDLCSAQVRTKADWRETMQPGTWLSHYAIGNGTVTVSASPGGGASTFSGDPTQPVVLQSTGSCNNRNFTLTSTIGPTGGGTVFRGGNFFQGQMTIGDGSTVIVDSYNSAMGPYSSLTAGSNATFWTNSNSSGSLTIEFPATFKGTLVAGPTAVLGTVVNLIGAVLSGPTSTSNATESRTAGVPITPNFAGLTAQSTAGSSPTPGVYSGGLSINSGTVSFRDGAYEFNGNLVVGSLGTLTVPAGANATIYTTGNFSVAGALTLGSGSTLTIYSGGNIGLSGRVNRGGTTTSLQVIGMSSCCNVTFSSAGNMSGVIYAPSAAVTMNNSSQLYGAMVASTITMNGTSQFHFDEATKNLRIDGLTGGSAPPGNADYYTSLSTPSN